MAGSNAGILQATATMNAAIEFLTRNFNAGILIDFENPNPDAFCPVVVFR